MAIEKVYKCDLCGEFVHKDAVRRVGVRLLSDRPEAADWIELGPCCHARPIIDLLVKAQHERRLTEDGE